MSKISKIFLVIVSLFICQQAGASTTKDIVNKATQRFEDLSKVIQVKGPETVANSINTGQEKNYQNTPLVPLEGDETNGGHIVLVQGGKILASPIPSEIGKDISNDPVVMKIQSELKNNPEEKVEVHFAESKKTALAWGRKALLGDRLDKKTHLDLFCYVLFDNPGS